MGQLKAMAPVAGGLTQPQDWQASEAKRTGIMDDLGQQTAMSNFIMDETHKELAKQEARGKKEEKRIASLPEVQPTSKEPVIFQTPSKELAAKDEIANRIREGVLKLEKEENQTKKEEQSHEKAVLGEMVAKSKQLGVTM